MAEQGGIEIDLTSIFETFVAESAEGLSAMEQALVELESRPADAEALQTVFRVTHTIKGNAGSLGFAALAEFAHAFEDVLAGLRSRAVPVTPALVTLLLRAVDLFRRMIPAAAAGEEALEPAAVELLAGLRALQTALEAAVAPAAHVVAPPPAERRESAGRRRDDVDREKTLRVGVGLLDRLMNLTGEIAIAHGRLRQTLSKGGGSASAAVAAHGEAERLFGDLQQLVMQARLVPLGPVFRRHVRTVRDAATSCGKLARLVIEGEEVEVDTSVVEHVRDPLTHLVRNAIDHGIESRAGRAAAGKDPCGTVTLRAFQDGGSIVIEVADDGAGLDRERILSRARETGLVAEGVQLAGADVLRLIFEPGFSTSEVVTDLSGRGVGLDVVQRNITALRGTVGVASEPGHGTTITLRLPLTLAVIAGLNVGVEGETFVIPLEAVVECVELARDERPHEDGRGVVNLRGQSLPFVSLAHLFDLGRTSERGEVVVVRTEEGMAGLAVDVVHGDGQTVIKPLGRLFRGVAGVSGASILGDGRVALILDVAAIVRHEHARQAAQQIST